MPFLPGRPSAGSRRSRLTRGHRSAQSSRLPVPRNRWSVVCHRRFAGGALVSGSVIIDFETRPEIIRLLTVIKALEKSEITVHRGQHFDEKMSGVFIDQVGIGQPDIGGKTLGAQIGEATMLLEVHLVTTKPPVVMVQGDTNSGLAGSLAANAAGVSLAHLEVGLPTSDRNMPEEHNRVVIDALADLSMVPHQTNADQLLREGVSPDRIAVTGNTLEEAVMAIMLDYGLRECHLLQLGLMAKAIILETIHRAENTGHPSKLRSMAHGVGRLQLRAWYQFTFALTEA